MRSLGLIGLVLALLIVGVLVKKQMNSVVPPVAAPQSGAPAPTVRAQSQQIQQQVREQLDAATQARPLPDDAK